jgi:hypothetical protein
VTTTTPNARDEISAIIHEALAGIGVTVVKYDGVDSLDPPSLEVNWARATIGHEDGGQRSLSGPTSGKIRWGENGVIVVQCFGLMTEGGLTKAVQMACAVRDAFRGRATAGGVWFRRQTIREVGIDKGWYQVNATLTFDYDEVK